MVTEPGVYSGACPARELLDRIANKWTTLIVGLLSESGAPVRFTELRRAIAGSTEYRRRCCRRRCAISNATAW